MATQAQMAAALYQRFKDVPTLTELDTQAVIDEMVMTFGLLDEIPGIDVPKYLMYATSEMAMKIALNTAHYFKFIDGEETVDKSLVSENYRRVAKDYRSQFDQTVRDENRRPTSKFKNAHRIDRPPFQW